MSNTKRLTEAQVIASLVEILKSNDQFHLDEVTDALDLLRTEQSSFRPVPRSELINQLRHALHLAEIATVVEFEIGDTGFCFEYNE